MKIAREALRLSFPVMVGYVFLGIAFGILCQQQGYSMIWAFFDQSERIRWKYAVCFTDILSCRIFTCRGCSGYAYGKCTTAVLWAVISEKLPCNGKETLVYDVFPDR